MGRLLRAELHRRRADRCSAVGADMRMAEAKHCACARIAGVAASASAHGDETGLYCDLCGLLVMPDATDTVTIPRPRHEALMAAAKALERFVLFVNGQFDG